MHPAPLDPSLKGKNVILFDKAKDGNPIAKNGEVLFLPDPKGYCHDDIKVNPKHPSTILSVANGFP